MKKIVVTIWVPCSLCNGTGIILDGMIVRTCSNCQGSGYVKWEIPKSPTEVTFQLYLNNRAI